MLAVTSTRFASRRRVVTIVAGLSLMPALVAAQGGRGAPPAPDTSARARVDALFAQWDRTDSPGCVVGVFRGGRIAYARGYGMANLELGVALSPQSVLDIGSTSKQFTALSLVLLAKDGALSLDDDIRKYVPEMRSYGATITIRHLLNHTSGIRDYLTLFALAGIHYADYTTENDAFDLITRQRELNFPPGEQYLYSNSGFFLAGVIVKRASGKSLGEFARERIFVPLGMTHTRFNDDYRSIIPNRATGYSRRGGAALTGRDAWATNMSDFEQVGDGAVATTIEDLQKWDENFYTGAVGGRDGVAMMQTPGKLTNGEVLTYALGLTVSPIRGLRSVSHGGSWAGYRAELLRFPDQHFSVAAQCNNSVAPSTLARRVAEIYIGSHMTDSTRAAATSAPGAGGRGAVAEQARPAWSPTTAELAPLAGFYYGAEINETYELRMEGSSLLLHRRRAAPAPLRPTTTDVFSVGGYTIRLIRERGRVTAFLVDAGRPRNLRFEKR
jgi:CubicO group peptidase (beta-lactamase class C family)